MTQELPYSVLRVGCIRSGTPLGQAELVICNQHGSIAHQVEYAMEAIGNAGSAVGILAKDGVVLAAEKRITSKVWGCPIKLSRLLPKPGLKVLYDHCLMCSF